MERRDFLKDGGVSLLALWSAQLLPGLRLMAQETAEQAERAKKIINWADPALGAKASASTFVTDPPGGYAAENVFGDFAWTGWQTDKELAGSWVQIDFGEPREVGELWFFSKPLPTDVLGQDVYNMTYPRVERRAEARKIKVSFSSGAGYETTLRDNAGYFQVFALPAPVRSSFIRIAIEDVWPKAGATETGIGKIRVFSKRHETSFEIFAHAMYDVQNGRAVQAATLEIVNPGAEIAASRLRVFEGGAVSMTDALQAVPAHASFKQSIWIPAPFEDAVMEFEAVSKSADFCCRRSLHVPRYRSYFDGGTFELNCTNHNDLGWLSTQAKTADYRSSDQIVPALELMREYPEFTYSMECTAYLMEFLERHPELREEMEQRMREKRFTWGASYVNLLQVSAGPEKLVRQFYLGRRWLKKNFPGVDSRFYIQSDPPQMSLQMPQILAKAGIKYCILGRMPFGFYHWRSPDGSEVLAHGYRYADPNLLLDPKDNSGWLQMAAEREEYYASIELPRMFIYDFTSDYLPPQPELVPYVRRQNRSMEAFASVWNAHFPTDKSRQISPPKMLFTTPEASLDKFMANGVNLPSFYGDWPLSWAYYDEPSNREALLDGRIAHNELLAAERLYAGLSLHAGFAGYPAEEFAAAWKANIWPDHGWGGNLGTETDRVYAESYAKSRDLSGRLLAGVGSNLAQRIPRAGGPQIPLAVFNCLSWARTDLVEFMVAIPGDWPGWRLVDETGAEVPCELLDDNPAAARHKIAFVARDVPTVGYRSFFIEKAATRPGSEPVTSSDTMENDFFRLVFGRGGIQSLYDKKRRWEVLRTEKFNGGEVLQFTAPGMAWEDPERVGMQDFDRTGNHDFRFTSFKKSAICQSAVREAHFGDFVLRERFSLYNELDRLDIEVELLDWKGTKERELRIAFPLNLDEARLSYEVPFGTVEMGKDELDFSRLPSNLDSQFFPGNYGGDDALAFREAINWIDASSPHSYSAGCMAASDSTLHVFKDETEKPVSYPVLQHVLLSSRKSLAWNPDYWYTQAGDHRYRLALLPHAGGWRRRYREAIGLNYRLVAFVGQERAASGNGMPASDSFLRLTPSNLVLTAMKKDEEDERIVIRFYEAEGDGCTARIELGTPIRHASKASLIEEDGEAIVPLEGGAVEFQVAPWEIVTLKLAI
jgi:alpha-mannosidase